MSEGETTTVSDDLVCEEILLSADGTDVNEEILQISQKILNQNVQASGDGSTEVQIGETIHIASNSGGPTQLIKIETLAPNQEGDDIQSECIVEEVSSDQVDNQLFDSSGEIVENLVEQGDPQTIETVEDISSAFDLSSITDANGQEVYVVYCVMPEDGSADAATLVNGTQEPATITLNMDGETVEGFVPDSQVRSFGQQTDLQIKLEDNKENTSTISSHAINLLSNLGTPHQTIQIRMGNNERKTMMVDDLTPENIIQRPLKTLSQKAGLGIGRGRRKRQLMPCRECGKTFGSYKLLNLHMRIHHDMWIFNCNVCGMGFDKQSTYQRHLYSHQENKPFKCEICGKTFSSPGHLVIHNRSHTGFKPYPCNTCGKMFSDTSNLRRHEMTHDEQRAACKVCGKDYKNLNSLTTHMRSHDKCFKCALCNRTFYTPDDVSKHYQVHTERLLNPPELKPRKPSKAQARKAAHRQNVESREEEGEGDTDDVINESPQHGPVKRVQEKPASLFGSNKKEPFRCGACGKCFSVLRLLRLHISHNHQDMLFTCRVCGRGFEKETVLNRHAWIHLNLKPVKCNVCDKSFRRPTHLKLHMRTHTGDKPYTCAICNKGFTDSSNMKRHLRTHNGERCKCRVCCKEYKNVDSLTTHMRCHEKCYQCTICEKTFYTPEDVQTHYEKVHIEPDQDLENPNDEIDCSLNFTRTRYVRAEGILDSSTLVAAEGLSALGDSTSEQMVEVPTNTVIEEIIDHTDSLPDEMVQNETLTVDENGDVVVGKKSSEVRKVKVPNRKRAADDVENRLYNCGYCGRGFTTAYHMAVHARRHLGQTSFKCRFCGKGFVESSNLRRHVRTHTGERPFKCTMCDRAFKESSALKIHMMRHTGERNYKCYQCQKAFPTPLDLTNHNRRHHEGKPGIPTKPTRKQRRQGFSSRASRVPTVKESEVKPEVTQAEDDEGVFNLNDLPKQTTVFISESTILPDSKLDINKLESGEGITSLDDLDSYELVENVESVNLAKLKTIYIGDGFTVLIGDESVKSIGEIIIKKHQPVVNEEEVVDGEGEEEGEGEGEGEEGDYDIEMVDKNEMPMELPETENKELPVDIANIKVEPGLQAENGTEDAAEPPKKKKKKKEKPHKCPQCLKAFYKMENLEKHMKRHENEQENQQTTTMIKEEPEDSGYEQYVPPKKECDICGMIFKHMSSLRAHAAVHSDARPFTCDVCGRRFKYSRDVHKHKIIHQPDYPYHCEVCYKGFNFKQSFNRHRELHERKPYNNFDCDVCDEKFPTSTDLIRHMHLHLKDKLTNKMLGNI